MARSLVVRHETAVGAFVILSGALLASFLVVKGAHVGFGARTVTFRADAGHDLKRGAAVKMRGIEVGEVADVQLMKDNSVEVKVKIFPEYADNVNADSLAAIDEPPFLGSTSVKLTPGKKDEKIAEGQKLETEVTEGLLHKIEAKTKDVEKVLDRVNAIAAKAEGTIEQVSSIAKKINDGQGIVGRLINDEQLASEFTSGVKGVVQLVNDVKDGKGAFALLKDEQLAPDIRTAVADVRSMTSAIARGDGALGRLMTNATIVTEGEGVLTDVRGALARLDQITKDTAATQKKVQDTLDSARGTIDGLGGTIKNVEKITGELAQVSEKINKGQGSLAKLVNDDALHKETKALLKELRESVEDLREQAPINSFIGVVFSAF